MACQPAQPATLAPGESLVCEGIRTIVEDDLFLDAIELYPNARAVAESGFALESTSTLRLPRYQGGPLIHLGKQATLDDSNGNGLGDVGETISYGLIARNNGDSEALDVCIADPLLPDLDCVPLQPLTLAPGAELACTGTLIISASHLDQGDELLNLAEASTIDTMMPGGRQYSQASAAVALAKGTPPAQDQVFADGFESKP